MTTGKQEDLVNFITSLLKRSVRSVGTTVKPSTSDAATKTSARYVVGVYSMCSLPSMLTNAHHYLFSTHNKGVGDDVTNVVVKPYVQTKDSFVMARPATRTQPTWTDLVLTCDAGTNTQVFLDGSRLRICALLLRFCNYTSV